MALAYVALGSNVGDRVAHLAHAVRRLGEVGEVTGLSGVYETEPVGYLDQPRFLNMVVAVRTALDPAALLAAARRIEAERGRERLATGGPRTLDVDVLLYDDRVVREPELEVPHPRMRDRPFVLVPLLELDPDLTEPGTGRSYAAHLAALEPAEGMTRFMEGEGLLNEANG